MENMIEKENYLNYLEEMRQELLDQIKQDFPDIYDQCLKEVLKR